jgi:hypothetical protein
MNRALIGHTGFVGSGLMAAGGFTSGYNSKNIEQMAGRRFEEVVCAGLPSVKWLANKEPEADRATIRRLLDVLETVETKRFVLISTIDVYPDPAAGLDETATLEGLPNHAYGTHRLEAEDWVRNRFPQTHIIRLPALFGDGLKKNALFDLLTGNQVEKLNPGSVFQWYPTRRLPGDIARTVKAGLNVVNLFTEPLPLRTVIDRYFPGAPAGPAGQPAPHYDLHTRHATLFGGDSPYIMPARLLLLAMGDFITSWPRRR